MSRFHRWLLPVLCAAILALGPGCGGGSSTSKPSEKTPLQCFKEEQANTIPLIMTDSIMEKDDLIQYQTEDGKKWSVGYSKRANGTYQFGVPYEVR